MLKESIPSIIFSSYVCKTSGTTLNIFQKIFDSAYLIREYKGMFQLENNYASLKLRKKRGDFAFNWVYKSGAEPAGD
jgi:hypothetical protein